MAQRLKHLPPMRETQVRSLGQEDPLEKERLHAPVFWPGEFHGLYSPWGRKELDLTEQLSFHFQYSCLKNPQGQESLAGYSPWGRKELDTTD